MNALGDLKIFLLILAGIVVVWFLIGGGGSDSDFSLYDGDSYISDPNNPDADSGEILYPGFLNSPYAGFIELNKARAQKKDPQEEYLEIEVDKNFVGSVDVTGWKLESFDSGKSFEIPEVALVPEWPDTVSENDKVFLEAKHTLYVVTSGSPIRSNFRTNVCTGYFEENKNFTPRLDTSCPKPEDEDLSDYGISKSEDDCIDAIRRVNTCEDPPYPDEEDDLSNDCEEYIGENINYETCISLHAADSYFLGTEWYVYMDENFYDVWEDNSDIIILFDSQNRVVDVVEYD